MTFREARKLKKRKSYVMFAGSKYLFIHLQKIEGIWMVVIEDKPNHEALLLLSGVTGMKPSTWEEVHLPICDE